MPAEKISINGYAGAVDELLERLGIERAAVVGNSMGGFIGAELAIEFSTRVERLVLVSRRRADDAEIAQRPRAGRAAPRRERPRLTARRWLGARSDSLSRAPAVRARR